jgi:hypothetical protein
MVTLILSSVIMSPITPVVALAGSSITEDLHSIHIMMEETENFRLLNAQAIENEQIMYANSRLMEKQNDLDTQALKNAELLELESLTPQEQETLQIASAGGVNNTGFNAQEMNLQQTQGRTQGLTVEQVLNNKDAIIKIDNPDTRYCGYKVTLPPDQRDLLERLVTGEAGATYEGSLLVAQCIRDAIVCDNYKSIAQVRSALKYTGSINRGACENAKRAVAEIFDEGKVAVQHRIYYFYAPALVYSQWHETQYFVLEKDGHRYFDRITDINTNKTLNGVGGLIELPDTTNSLLGFSADELNIGNMPIRTTDESTTTETSTVADTTIESTTISETSTETTTATISKTSNKPSKTTVEPVVIESTTTSEPDSLLDTEILDAGGLVVEEETVVENINENAPVMPD